MAQLTAKLRTPWGAAVALWSARLRTPWAAAAALWSTGGAYTPPAPPVGGTPTGPSGAAGITVATANVFNLVHALEVRDLRDDTVLPVEAVAIATERGSVFWTLRASGGPALFSRLSAGEQPPRVRVTLDGAVWEFVVEAVLRTRQHAAAQVSIEGRSLACAAGAPYESDRLWAIEGDTTAAQIAAAANLFTELDVRWGLDDWLVPEGVFSVTGTPLAVVQRVAEAGGGEVQALRAGYGVTVRPQYLVLPNEWEEVAPDVELPLAVLDEESFRVTDQPPYDGVVVAGQQQGIIGLVRLAGTSGGNQAPMVSDPLITEVPAARQRGQAVLGRSGKQQEHSLRLPLPRVSDVAVVPERGQLVRVMDSPPWVGMVVSVQVSAQLPAASLSLTLERHTEAIVGTTVLPPPTGPVLGFSPPIADIVADAGSAVSVNVGSRWSGGVPPYRYTLRSGALPPWLALNEATAQLTGTAPGAAEETTIALRATDAINSTADSNDFQVRVVVPAPTVQTLMRSRFDGTNGQTAGVADEGLAASNWAMAGGAALSSFRTFAGATSVRVPPGGSAEHAPASTLTIATDTAITVECRVLLRSLGAGTPGFVAATVRFITTAAFFNLQLLRGATASTFELVIAEDPDLLTEIFNADTWVHLCLSVAANGDYIIFLGGAVVGTGTGFNMSGSRNVLGAEIVAEASPNAEIFVDNLRVRSGFVYTGAFTPDATI